LRIPKYRKHAQWGWAFVEVNGQRITLPGRYNSPESRAAYADVLRSLAAVDARPAEVASPAWSFSIARLVEGYLDHAVVYYGGNQE
jgi:hypothetical protein